MTDVVKKLVSGNTVKNNSYVAYVSAKGTFVEGQYGLNKDVYMSGYNGATDNGYLDDRFDNPTYYTA